MLDQDRLAALAESIADKTPSDWRAADVGARDARERRLVSHLRVVAAIGQARASLHGPPGDQPRRTSPPQPALAPGTLWGDLRILERLGQGRFGDVYRAWDPALDREVALKLLRPSDIGDDVAATVVDEGRLMARVRHPNVATIYGARRIDGSTGLWMELAAGPTLAAELRATGPFDAAALADVARAMCGALQAVHDAGLVHRDVKLQNVMRDASGRVVLGDFGTGRELADSADARQGLAGTPAYIAPEIYAGQPATPQSDLYSLGVLLFHLATGEFPVAPRTLGELRAAHARGERRLLATARRDLPSTLTTAVDCALDPDPRHRFASAQDMATALAAPAGGRRRRFTAGATVLVALVAGALGSIGRFQARTGPELREVAVSTPVALVAVADGRAGNARVGPNDSARAAPGRPGLTRSAELLAHALDVAGPKGGSMHRPHLVEQLAREALAEDPGLVMAQVMLAHALWEQPEKRSLALPAAERTVAMAAAGSEVDRLVARAELATFRSRVTLGGERLGLWGERAAALEAVLAIEPRHQWALSGLTIAYADLGRHADSLRIAERFLALRPRSLAALWQAARAAEHAGEPARARSYADRAYDLDEPIDERNAAQAAWLRLFAARQAWLTGDVAAAARTVSRVRRDMAHLTPAAQAGFASQLMPHLLTLGQLEHAAAAAAQLREGLRAFQMSRVVSATLGQATTDADRALGREILSRYFPDPGAATNVISAHVLAGDVERAREAFAVLEAGPAVLPEYMRLVRAHLELVDGRPDQAIGQLERAGTEVAPRGSRMWAVTALTLANAYAMRGDQRRAIELLDDATQRRSDYDVDSAHAWLPLRHRLAELYRATGRAAEAEAVEDELRVLLQLADVDHPIRRQLFAPRPTAP